MLLKNKLAIFVHIPKCMGTSVEHALYPFAEASFGSKFAASHRVYRNKALFELIEITTNGFVFTFVRDPYSRALSCWNQYRKVERCDFTEFLNKTERFLSLGVEEHFREIEDNQTLFFYGAKCSAKQTMKAFREYPFVGQNTGYHVLPMTYFKPEKGFSFIGRMESATSDWRKLMEMLDLNVSLPHTRNKQSFKLRGALSKKNKELIECIYKDDFVEFGYSRW